MENQVLKNEVYSKEILTRIAAEFSRTKGTYYLDHAGATLYSEKQMQSIFSDLSQNTYGNPHTKSLSSQNTVDGIDIARYQILSHFHTSPEHYSVIFTSGTTAALKMVAETFDFNGGSMIYLEDNHTSVLGMRCFAPVSKEIKIKEVFNALSNDEIAKNGYPIQAQNAHMTNNLFVYPAQSNFSGIKYPLSWIEKVQNGALEPSKPRQNWFVTLDAATLVSTSTLDLSKHQPDFVTLSFYKIFGYPTGLGALLVRKRSEELLKKKYFGGGTVLMALSSDNVSIPRTDISERFEDGTNSFLSIISLKHGFDTIKNLGLTMDLISKHTFTLAKYTYEKLIELHHSNGKPIAIFYNDTNFDSEKNQGGIVTFNLKRDNGEHVGFAEVMHLANLYNIHLRTGCFCNPGACQRFLNLSAADVQKQFKAGHVCGDENDLIDGYPTGAVRVSFGYMSSYECADALLNLIESCFVTKPVVRKKKIMENKNKFTHEGDRIQHNGRSFKENVIIIKYNSLRNNLMKILNNGGDENVFTGKLTKVLLYPIKSCGAFCPQSSWKITSTGLQYDRKWMIVKASGSCVSQKQMKQLCLIQPVIDVKRNKMKIYYNDDPDFVEVVLDPLNEEDFFLNSRNNGYLCESKVCGDKIQGWDCGDEVADWLSEKLDKSGLRLLRQCDFEDAVGRSSTNDPDSQLSLANKGQFLLVNVASVRWLRTRIPEGDAVTDPVKELTALDVSEHEESILLRFRPNLAVDFNKTFVENGIETLKIGNATFQFSGNCTRCQMICIDQKTGEVSKEPLQTLSREMQGKIRFGIYLNHDRSSQGESLETGIHVEAWKRDNIAVIE